MTRHIRGGHFALQTGFGKGKMGQHESPRSTWCQECGWWVPLKKWSDHPPECPGVRGHPDPYKTVIPVWMRFIKWLRQTGFVRKVLDKKIYRPPCGPIPRTVYESHKLLDSEAGRCPNNS